MGVTFHFENFELLSLYLISVVDIFKILYKLYKLYFLITSNAQKIFYRNFFVIIRSILLVITYCVMVSVW